MRKMPEIYIVINSKGIRAVQVPSEDPEIHNLGHEMYLKIQHLLPELNEKILEVLKGGVVN